VRTPAGLGRAALVVSVGVLLSRLLGFLRDVVMAGLLGRGVEADLYLQAFIVPDYLLFLLAGGYLSITLVPILARHEAEGDDLAARQAFTAVFRFVGAALIVLTVVTIVFAGRLTAAVFPEVEQTARLTGLTRIALASQVFFGLGALYMAAQYARRRFLVPTLAPLVYNLGIIGGGLAGWAAGDPSPESFLWGGLVGAVLGNFALQWWGARREGMRIERGTPLRHPAVGEYLGLAVPLMVGQSVVALDEQWPRLFGQFVDQGATAGLGFARRLNMVPVGVIAQAAGVAAFPFLARLAATGERKRLRDTVAVSVKTAVAVGGLAAAVVVGLAEPAVRLAYQRGDFLPGDTAFVAPLLAIYGLSIPMWAAHQVFTRAFYAGRRMWLPVAIGTAVTVAAVPVFVWVSTDVGAAGIAWTSVGSVTAYTFAIGAAWIRSSGSSAAGYLGSAARVLAAGVPAGIAARVLADRLGTGTGGSVAAVLVGGLLAAAVYFAAGRLVGLRELTAVTARVRARLGRS
jgi:putative peptidoglycan lipid II flippase